MISLHKYKDVNLEQMMPLIRERLAQGKKVTFGPKGISMRPMLRQGIDRVEITAVTGKLKKYDLPFYMRDNGQYVLHRIIKAGDTYTCMGDNQFILEPGIRQDQLIAVMSGFYRGDKYISADAFSYKCYCRYWHWTRLPRKCVRRTKPMILRTLVKIRNFFRKKK